MAIRLSIREDYTGWQWCVCGKWEDIPRKYVTEKDGFAVIDGSSHPYGGSRIPIRHVP